MAISVGSDYYLNNSLTSQSATKAEKLSSSLRAMDSAAASDEELLESCKEFEAYFTEQMFKAMQKMIPESESVSSSTRQLQDYYKEQMIQSYAEQSAQGEGLGLAQMLYEQMKRNYGLE